MGEYSSLETVSAAAAFIVAHGEMGAALLNYVGNDIEEAVQWMEERYDGEYSNESDFAEQLTESLDQIPEPIAAYIDYERMARDLFISDYVYFKGDDSIHVFRNH